MHSVCFLCVVPSKNCIFAIGNRDLIAMKYKVLALDLDGTLTNSDKGVSEHTFRTLCRAQQAGVKVLLVSGRPTPGVQWVADMIELHKQNGYLLAYNGSEIIESSTGSKIFDF